MMAAGACQAQPFWVNRNRVALAGDVNWEALSQKQILLNQCAAVEWSGSRYGVVEILTPVSSDMLKSRELHTHTLTDDKLVPW